MKELGRLLIEAHALCEKHGTSFSDYLDRVLALPRTSAHVIMKAHTMDLDPRVGFENMRSLVAIRDEGAREKAQTGAAERAQPGHGEGPQYRSRRPPKDPRVSPCRRSANGMEKSIDGLKKRLKEIEKRIAEMAKE